jgi:hypothetical protein
MYIYIYIHIYVYRVFYKKVYECDAYQVRGYACICEHVNKCVYTCIENVFFYPPKSFSILFLYTYRLETTEGAFDDVSEQHIGTYVYVYMYIYISTCIYIYTYI